VVERQRRRVRLAWVGGVADDRDSGESSEDIAGGVSDEVAAGSFGVESSDCGAWWLRRPVLSHILTGTRTGRGLFLSQNTKATASDPRGSTRQDRAEWPHLSYRGHGLTP
jgi:hypothetical protein